MNDPEYWRLIEAGYAPEQIWSCWPCKCKREGHPVKDCTFPTHKAGVHVACTEADNVRALEVDARI